MPKQRILATAPISLTPIQILEQIAPVEISPKPDADSLLTQLTGTIAIVARGVEAKIDRSLIEAAPELRVIGRPGAGYDTVDIAAATARRIPVVIAPVSGFAVAEGAIALLLAIVKKIPFGDSLVRQGQWQRRYEYSTGDMTEHTLGIVGLGRIGSGLARLAQAFEMKILGYDPLVSAERGKALGVEMASLDELLARSDYVSLHMPLSEDTRGLINRERIARMKRGAILINTARGGVIESLDVLADALESGQLSAVGLDVFPTEPPDHTHRLFKDSRLLCAPHMLGVSDLAMERIYRSMAADMVSVLRGERPRFCVNPEVLA
ncbi:MAG: hydroxyacid dehydrogenase [Acidimicrobiia bacterium]|nr:hydroxyacid dehydrogenase [Acidimicrobiia bacterium]